jgi:tRNA-dihydrouridine synthase B
MAGVADSVFRAICKEYGADIVVSEMVSAEGLVHNSGPTEALMHLGPGERPAGVQLFGSEPASLSRATARACELVQPDFIDLNSGCPVRKVVRHNGGASLMRDPERFGRILEAMVKASAVPVTVKIRSGWHTGTWVDVEFARIAEQSGVAAITLHPRSVAMLYSGHSFWERIALVKQAVRIPVIGNGDITRPEHARQMFEQTGCDSVMIGRGSMGNPWLFAQCHDMLEGREPRIVTVAERLAQALAHVRQCRDAYGERRATAEMKSHVAWYTKGIPGASKWRTQLFQVASTAQLEELLTNAMQG